MEIQLAAARKKINDQDAKIVELYDLQDAVEQYTRKNSLEIHGSLFQPLCQCGRLKKRAGDERGLVEKEGATGEPVSIVLKTSLRYTSSWYTL